MPVFHLGKIHIGCHCFINDDYSSSVSIEMCVKSKDSNKSKNSKDWYLEQAAMDGAGALIKKVAAPVK